MCALATLASCVNNVEEALHIKSKKSSSTRVTNTVDANQIIQDKEDQNIKLQVISESMLKQAALNKSISSISNSKVMSILSSLPQGEAAESVARDEQVKTQEETLMIGFPIGLIGEQNIFGGVITKVTDKDSESLGTLKLTDLSPIHVRTVISRLPDGTPALTLTGCFSKCDEDSEQSALINFPIIGFNQEAGLLIVDMSTIGKELDLITMLDPQGEYTQLKAISSDTTSVEYDMKTLIFDIKTKMIPVTADANDASVKTTDFSVRWYLKLNSAADPSFRSREPVEGVGFFKTERAKDTKITRFSINPKNGEKQPTIKYYIKNVPEEYEKYFTAALDSWNKETTEILGRPLLSYEVIKKDDPRNELLVPGDIRYNIIEWDLDNRAGYGGLGPSIANQFTGETMSANVLIQGPTIVKLYTKWFGVSKAAETLKAEGKVAEANKLIKEFNQSVQRELGARTKTQFKLKLGKHLDMTVHAQKEELQDPIAKEFEVVPAGITYDKYMQGYFGEMLAHELGHNLGLRHNFKGNLGAIDTSTEKGSVSRSIMEYLGRPYRHLNAIGAYDRMAIAYGYKGVAPTHKDWFCTDEDQGSDAKSLAMKSPECTKSDATSDPFTFWEGRIGRVLDLVLETKSNTAPVWKTAEVQAQLSEAVTGMSAYALSAEATAQTWTNFFGKADRPENKKEVKNYVLMRLKSKICNPALADVIAAKDSAEARELAQNNMSELAKTVAEKTAALGLYSASDLSCE